MSAARVLMVHNAYQQRGGEDSVVDSEVALLRAHGHEVHVYARHNDDIDGGSKLSLAAQSMWSRRTSSDIAALMADFRPDVMHVHNTWPLVSPSVYWAARRLNCPVVQTMHNFRLMCPQAMFLREGRICEDCLGRVPWRGVVRACYRASVPQTAVLASAVTLHRALGTYDRAVTAYIALNEFCRNKFIEGGLPADRIVIKPNFVEDTGPPRWHERRGGGLFVGRLSVDKGVDVLLDALKAVAFRVEVIGAGDLQDKVQAQLGEAALGFLPVSEILNRMRQASYLVVPSLWYENFPRILVEAFSCGLPVVASRLGALAELVEEGRTGLLFEPGNARDLAAKLQWAHDNPDAMRQMGQRARQVYETRYTPDINYKRLIEIYDQAIIRTRS
jgi:glycosyltransferase involved in cell wall biosynthesis